MVHDPDILIIGGGPAGATAALLLARAGWSVVVLEKKQFPRRKVCGEYLSATNLPLLDHLDVGEAFRRSAGPEVRRVGLFAGSTTLTADLPRAGGAWGRALARECLDTLLLERAAAAGAEVLQPWSAVSLVREEQGFRCQVESQQTGEVREARPRVVVAAHGSWEPGGLPTQPARPAPSPSDLFGFKAHFRGTGLADDLMPLLAFPGGYGGMVHCDRGLVSLSCCVRRDVLACIRRGRPVEAGPAVLGHMLDSCRGVREVLAGAKIEGPWLAAGPIRTGIRLHRFDGIFRVGNAAGEAHPVIAEGISMALQSARLLVGWLEEWRRGRRSLAEAGQAYHRAWRKRFTPRLRTAALVAHWAMRPALVASALPLLHSLPGILTWGARLAGKATMA